MIERNKLRRLQISPELLFELFRDGEHMVGSGWAVTNGIPPDAELVNIHHLWPNSIEILIRSESFAALQPSGEIPILAPLVERKQPA